MWLRISLLTVGVLLSSTLAASALPLNIDFGDHGGIPADSYGAASGQAGAWNEIASLGLNTGLLDLSGAATGATLNLSAYTITGWGGGVPANDTERMIKDNFYSATGTHWSFEVTGLTDGLYDIYVYAPDNTYVTSRNFLVNGVAVAELPGHPFSGPLVEGTNYVHLADVAISAGGLLVQSSTTGGYGGLSAIQIVSTRVPEPSTLALVACALLGFALCRRQGNTRSRFRYIAAQT